MKRHVVKFGPDVVRQALLEWMIHREQLPPPYNIDEHRCEVQFTDDSVKLIWGKDETRSSER